MSCGRPAAASKSAQFASQFAYEHGELDRAAEIGVQAVALAGSMTDDPMVLVRATYWHADLLDRLGRPTEASATRSKAERLLDSDGRTPSLGDARVHLAR